VTQGCEINALPLRSALRAPLRAGDRRLTWAAASE
jgi:hypothetical protein